MVCAVVLVHVVVLVCVLVRVVVCVVVLVCVMVRVVVCGVVLVHVVVRVVVLVCVVVCGVVLVRVVVLVCVMLHVVVCVVVHGVHGEQGRQALGGAVRGGSPRRRRRARAAGRACLVLEGQRGGQGVDGAELDAESPWFPPTFDLKSSLRRNLETPWLQRPALPLRGGHSLGRTSEAPALRLASRPGCTVAFRWRLTRAAACGHVLRDTHTRPRRAVVRAPARRAASLH